MSPARAPKAVVPPDPAAADLAVVIVNYNAGDYLERCLASLAVHRGDVSIDVLVIEAMARWFDYAFEGPGGFRRPSPRIRGRA